MADPFSIIAGIAGVAATTAQLSIALYRITGLISSAPEEIEEMASKLAMTSSIFEQLQETLDSARNLYKVELLTDIARIINRFEKVQTSVKKLLKKSDGTSRIFIVFQSVKMRPLLAKVESLKSDINLALWTLYLAREQRKLEEQARASQQMDGTTHNRYRKLVESLLQSSYYMSMKVEEDELADEACDANNESPTQKSPSRETSSHGDSTQEANEQEDVENERRCSSVNKVDEGVQNKDNLMPKHDVELALVPYTDAQRILDHPQWQLLEPSNGVVTARPITEEDVPSALNFLLVRWTQLEINEIDASVYVSEDAEEKQWYESTINQMYREAEEEEIEARNQAKEEEFKSRLFAVGFTETEVEMILQGKKPSMSHSPPASPWSENASRSYAHPSDWTRESSDVFDRWDYPTRPKDWQPPPRYERQKEPPSDQDRLKVEEKKLEKLEELLLAQQEARKQRELAKEKAAEEAKIRAAQAKAVADQASLQKLEKLILAQKEEQLRREEAVEAERLARKAEAEAKVAEKQQEAENAEKLRIAAQKAKEAAEAKASEEALRAKEIYEKILRDAKEAEYEARMAKETLEKKLADIEAARKKPDNIFVRRQKEIKARPNSDAKASQWRPSKFIGRLTGDPRG